MVIALEFKEKHNVGVNSDGKFYLDKENNSIESIKNVPMVIYNNFDNEEFIRENMDKFKYSCHVAFLNIGNACNEDVEMLNKLGVGIIVRFRVTQENESDIPKLFIEDSDIDFSMVDRVVIIDDTINMQVQQLENIKKYLAQRTGHKREDIGVCCSPFSFGENACLCAIWARKLMAKYTANTDVALPSANHEDMEECSCIRKKIILSDVEAPHNTSSKSSNGDKVSNKESKTKTLKGVSNIRGMF